MITRNTPDKTTMQAVSDKAQDVLSMMTGGDFSEGDMRDVASRLPSMMDGTNVHKVRFYQVWFRGQWVNAHDKIICRDHTERFYEVTDQLADLIVDSMNYCQVDPTTVPADIFATDDDNITAIKTSYRGYQDLVNIMNKYLPSSQYWFGINEFDVDY